jgi:hypothetical protein
MGWAVFDRIIQQNDNFSRQHCQETRFLCYGWDPQEFLINGSGTAYGVEKHIFGCVGYVFLRIAAIPKIIRPKFMSKSYNADVCAFWAWQTMHTLPAMPPYATPQALDRWQTYATIMGRHKAPRMLPG